MKRPAPRSARHGVAGRSAPSRHCPKVLHAHMTGSTMLWLNCPAKARAMKRKPLPAIHFRSRCSGPPPGPAQGTECLESCHQRVSTLWPKSRDVRHWAWGGHAIVW